MNKKYKVIFDPMLFEPSKKNSDIEEYETIEYLYFLIDFIVTNLDVEFDAFDDAPYVSFDPTLLPNSLYDYPELGKLFAIKKRIFNLINDYFIELKQSPSIHIESELNEYSNKKTFLTFESYLEYLVENDAPFHLFMSKVNHNLKKPLKCTFTSNAKYIKQIDNPEFDCETYLYKSIKINKLSDEFFPQKEICRHLNEKYLEEKSGLQQNQINSLINKYGFETAHRNGYMEDNRLSKLNRIKSGSLRTVFIRPTRLHKNFYLSLDYESGGIEVYDNMAIHQGQYSFSCELNKNADIKNHPLYLN